MTESQNVLAAQNQNTMAMVAYVCMIVGLFFPLGYLAGVIIAYVYRGSDAVLDTHFSNVISVFWWSLVVGIIGGVTAFFVIGWFILLGLYVWIIIRMAKGLGALKRGAAYGTTAAAPAAA